MGKKGILISCIIWIFFLIFELMEKYPVNQIIYVQSSIAVIILSIYIYKKGLKKYRNIPIKTVEAKFIKDYESYDTSNPGADRILYIGIYEYELNGEKHKIKLNSIYSTSWKDTITLFYKRGKTDITSDDSQLNDYSMWEGLKRILLIMPGSCIIVFIILYYILRIPIDF